MFGTGTIVNTAAVVLGGAAGMILKRGIKENVQETLIKSLGTATMFMGIGGALSKMLVISEGEISTQGTMLMIFSLAIGAVLGEILRVEYRMEQFGEFLRKLCKVEDNGRFLEGFLTNALVICIGAMAIVGSLQDGISGDASMLYAKSILDCVISMVFASSLGIGVLFSAVPLFLYQGSITLLGNFIAPYMTDLLIANITFIGNVLITLVGINLLFGKQIRVANLLPALLIPIIYVLI